jgi:hypothetical protein
MLLISIIYLYLYMDFLKELLDYLLFAVYLIISFLVAFSLIMLIQYLKKREKEAKIKASKIKNPFVDLINKLVQ